MRSFFERAHAAVKNGYTCLCKAKSAQTSSEYYAEQHYWVITRNAMNPCCKSAAQPLICILLTKLFIYTIKALSVLKTQQDVQTLLFFCRSKKLNYNIIQPTLKRYLNTDQISVIIIFNGKF